VTSMDAWLNPAYEDADNPAISAEVSVPVANVNEVQIRSQNSQIWIDELVFGEAWGEVVPRGLNRSFDSEALTAGHFPSQDGWMINESNRTGGFVEVTGYGLDYQVPEGAPIDGGIRAIALNGAPSPSLNEWLTNEVGTPAAGVSDLYFGMTFEADSIGVPEDAHELFLRLDGWNAYVAVKLYQGLLEVPGADAVSFAEEGTEALAGVTHRVVGKLGVDEDGFITSISAWLNPEPGDLGAPDVEGTRDGSVHVSDITTIELRSQKARTVVDDLVFGTTWNQVVPAMPADPGDLFVALPSDTDESEPGVQVNGGTLFVEVDGAAYEADTVLPIGTEVTFRAVPDTANDYVLTGFEGWKGPRDAVHPYWDFADASMLAEPVDTELEFTIAITESLDIEPIFEFGEHRLAFSEEGAIGYRVQVDGGGPNELRTLFDTGENVSVRAIAKRNYSISGWNGELAPIESSTAELVAGSGIFDGTLDVEAQSDFTVREMVTFDTAAEIAPNENGVEFQGENLGVPGSVPLAVMQEVVTTKAAQGLAGVVDFESILGSSDLLFDPSPDNNTPAPEYQIVRDAEGNVSAEDSIVGSFASLEAQIGEIPVIVELGEQAYIEPGGSGNLATAEGPGPKSMRETLFFKGQRLAFPALSINAGGRTATSGEVSVGALTSWDFAFDAEDKVVMSGIVYLSRDNFQHSNPDGQERLWAEAVYSDGSTSATLASSNIDQSAGDHDHFFGFESPQGAYIVNIRVWMQGGNARAFSNIDDLVVVLEGEETYTVAATSSDEEAGTVSGEGDFADGSVAGLTAEGIGTGVFSHWSYELAPDVIFGTDPSLNLVVHGPVSVIANFGEANIDPEDRTVPAAGGDFSLAVNVGSESEWTAESMASWITITDGEEGTGPGSVAYTVDVYEGVEARTGTIMVAGFTHAVTQEGIPDPTFAQVVEGVDLGDGVFHSPWFGRYETSDVEDWINHSEQGWLWTAEVSSAQGMWLYSTILDSWAWSNEDIYPVMYEAAGERYVYYITVAEGIGVMVFDYSTGEWGMLTP
ncbi:MAG: BACON domain-containing protein, partial [Oceanipulchritudo sp.]